METTRKMKYCVNCGEQIDALAEICPKCGVRVMSVPHYEKEWKPESNGWYLLPIFFGLLGGIVGWFCIRNKDPDKATNLVILGLFISVLVWVLL